MRYIKYDVHIQHDVNFVFNEVINNKKLTHIKAGLKSKGRYLLYRLYLLLNIYPTRP